jgi:hypothetical protein
MKRTLIGTLVVLTAMAVMFYFLITDAERVSHIHFTTQEGVLRNVIYYSAQTPEGPAQHDCDGSFTDMRDDLYGTQLRIWQGKYAGDRPRSR